MNKDKFTSLELAIFSFFIFSSNLSITIINLFKNYSTLDIILSVIIYFFIGLLLIKLFFKGYDFSFDKSNILIKFFFTTFSIIFSLYLTFNLSNVIKDIILPNMSINVIGLVFIIVSSILAFKGIKSLSIASNLFFILYLLIIIISFCFNIGSVNYINLLPISFNVDNISFLEVLLLSISPLYMMLIIPKKDIINFNKYKKYTYISYGLFSLYLIIKVLFITSILGIKYYSFIEYPYINILKMINIFDFFQRLEELFIINIFIEYLICNALSLYYSSNILNNIFKFNNKSIVLIDVVTYLIFINVSNINIYFIYVISFIFIVVNIFNYFCIRKTK